MDVEITYNIGRIKMRLKKIPLINAPDNIDDIKIFHPNDLVFYLLFKQTKNLEDRRTIGDILIKNDEILYYVYRNGEDSFEPVLTAEDLERIENSTGNEEENNGENEGNGENGENKENEESKMENEEKKEENEEKKE